MRKPVLDVSLRGFHVNSTRNIFAFAVILKDYSIFFVKVNGNRCLRIVPKNNAPLARMVNYVEIKHRGPTTNLKSSKKVR